MSAGETTFSRSTTSQIFSSVETNLRWLGRVPFSMTAQSMSPGIPAASRPAAISPQVATDMRNTKVPFRRTSASKSSPSAPFSRRWPVMKCTEAQKSRCVTGMPA